MKRCISVLLVLVLLLSTLGGLTVYAAGSTQNTGIRHELCTALSSQAEAYYTGSNTWEALSELEAYETDSSAEAVGSPLFNALHDLMRNTLTNTVSYGDLTSYWKTTDSAQGKSDAILFYSDFDSSVVDPKYNREHVWPKSQGNFYQSGAGSDLHHLRPTNSAVNSTRSHYTMGNVRGVLDNYQTYTYNGRDVLWLDSSYTAGDHFGIVEVQDNVKGDVARILLYVYTAYATTSGENTNLCVKTAASGSGNNANQGNKVIESLDTLLSWCELDPVDTWEMSRNDCVQNVQGNRNVFIDYPEFAWLLFGREVPEMDTPSGNAQNMQTETYNITAVSDDESHGTVTGSGKYYTAVPAEGYYAAGYTLDPADAAVVSQNGNSFRLSKVKADCTLTIHFALRSRAVLRFSVPDGVQCEPIEGYLSDTVRLPSPTGTPSDSAHSYSFVGWVSEPVKDQTQKPAYLNAGSEYTFSQESAVLYALYTYMTEGEGGATGEYTLTQTVGDGEYVVAAPTQNVMMNNDVSGNTYLGFNAVTFTGTTVTNATEINVFSFRTVGNYFAIYDTNGAALRADGAKKITFDTQKTEVTESDSAYLWSVTIDGGKATISPSTGSQGSIQYNSSAPRFTTYTSSQVPVSLYGSVSGTRCYTTLTDETPHVHNYQAVVTPPTCTEQGYTTYTCLCGESYVADYVDALGHDWDETTYEWAEDSSRCTATRICKRDASHVETETVATTSEVTLEPTMEAEGERTYTAAFENPAFGTQTWTEPIDKLEPPVPENPFVDVPEGAYYYNAVLWAVNSDPQITKGTDDTHFSPNDKCTRAQVVAFLWRAKGSPAPTSTENPFTDVPAGKYYTDAVLWAVENEITSGTAKDKFSPNAPCTRGQVVTFLWRAQGKPEPAASNPFTDVSDSAYYYKAVLWAVENEVTNGKTPTTFAPADTCTRGQIVTFLYRALAESSR